MPRYPEIRVRSVSSNPLAVVAQVRQALRRAGVAPDEIATFSREAMSLEDGPEMVQVCRRWVSASVQDALS